MMNEIISLFGLIISALKEIGTNVSKVKLPGKKKFLKQFVFLFAIFDSLKNHIVDVNNSLYNFKLETHIGMRVHYIHQAGFHFGNLTESLSQFFSWISNNEDLLSMT